jgi:hypothetical protein
MLAREIKVGNKKVNPMDSTKKNVNVIIVLQDIMDRGIDTIIMVIVNIAQSIIVGTGVHGDNGMIIEDTTIVLIEMEGTTDKMEVCTSNLKMKMVVLYFQLAGSFCCNR